jgi:hypothetical protein
VRLAEELENVLVESRRTVAFCFEKFKESCAGSIPLSRYSRGRIAREGLQLGFAAVEAREIRRGVQELAIALEQELRHKL